MKVQLYLEPYYILEFDKQDKHSEGEAILNKINPAIIDFPISPTVGMYVDITSFYNIFNLTENEIAIMNEDLVASKITLINIENEYARLFFGTDE